MKGLLPPEVETRIRAMRDAWPGQKPEQIVAEAFLQVESARIDPATTNPDPADHDQGSTPDGASPFAGPTSSLGDR